MANIASLFQGSEEPQSALPSTDRLRDIEEKGAQLIELRTENGAVYLCPSRWQRIRLQWTFRHFHVLSPQVLSQADQRLIEKLSQSAVVTPSLPVASKAVLGVVEKVRLKAPVSVNRVVTLRPAPPATLVFRAKPATPQVPSPDLSVVLKPREARVTSAAKAMNIRPFQQWKELGVLVAAGFIVILASLYRGPLFSRPLQMRNPQTLPASIERAQNGIKPSDLQPAAISPVLISPAALIPNTEKPHRWIAPPPAEATLAAEPGSVADSQVPALATVSDTNPAPAQVVASAHTKRPFISELPQGYFVHPVVSDGNLVGELQLKALIGADGSVKEVTVLSGSHALAEAGMRAVRQWHYSPYQVKGSPVEVETQIKMSFFGQDAVSIASVAGGSTSQRQ